MSPFVNLTNHPVAHWAAPQRQAAEAFGAPIIDVPFPIVPPNLAVEGLAELVERTLQVIPDGAEVAMVAGEHTLTFALVVALQRKGIACVTATSARRSELGTDGQKHVEFFFERFREYPGNPMRLPAPLEAVTAPPQQDAKPEAPETEAHETEAPRAPVNDLRRSGGVIQAGSRSGWAEPGLRYERRRTE